MTIQNEFEMLEEKLWIEADDLMDRLIAATLRKESLILSHDEACFLYRACQVFKSK